MDEMKSGAEHVLAHGTARTRAAAGGGAKGGGKEVGGKESADGPKKLSHIEVHPDSKGPGRHMVHKHHPPHNKPEHDETYSVGDQAAMHAHLDEHMPEAAAGGAEEAGAGGGEEQAAEEAMMERGGEGGAAGASAG